MYRHVTNGGYNFHFSKEDSHEYGTLTVSYGCEDSKTEASIGVRREDLKEFFASIPKDWKMGQDIQYHKECEDGTCISLTGWEESGESGKEEFREGKELEFSVSYKDSHRGLVSMSLHIDNHFDDTITLIQEYVAGL